MTNRRIHPVRAFALTVLAAALAWLVVTRSLAAYFASAAPATALALNPNSAAALLNRADAEFARSVAAREGPEANPKVETRPAGRAGGESPEQASDSLQLWAGLGTKTSRGKTQDPSQGPTLTEETAELLASWARLALINDPLNARAASILGQLADLQGEETKAEQFFRLAAQRSIRERVASYWLMQKGLEGRDFASAVYHADTLLRTRSQATRYVLPVLMEIAEMKDGADVLQKVLLTNPPWRSSFLAAYAQTAADPRAVLELLLALRASPAPAAVADLRNYIQALMQRQQHELAYYAWLEFLAPTQLNSAGFLFNGSFEQIPSGLPFDWIIGEGTGVSIDIIQRPQHEKEKALYIEFGYGRVEFPRLQQLTLLAPGSYEFKGGHQAELQGKRGMVWRVACLERQSVPLGESPMALGPVPKWKDFAFSFKVPASGCRVQQVRLELDARMASEQLLSGYIWYDDLRIERLDATHR